MCLGSPHAPRHRGSRPLPGEEVPTEMEILTVRILLAGKHLPGPGEEGPPINTFGANCCVKEKCLCCLCINRQVL